MTVVGRSRVYRTKKFLSVILKNRMAVVGLTLLILFSSTAVAAPLITPYDPEREIPLAGAFASPGWMAYFPDSRLSQNLDFMDDPQFTNQDSDQQWTLTPQGNGLELAYDAGVSANLQGGSLRVSYTRLSSPGTTVRVIVQKTIQYPYGSPPSAFTGSVLVRAEGATLEEPILVTMFTGRLESEIFPLAKFNFTANTSTEKWAEPPISICSSCTEFRDKVLRLGGSNLPAATILFPTPGTYRLGFELQFTDKSLSPTKSSRIYIDDLDVRLLGNAFGWLGTDGGGRDLFTQLVYGARVSLVVGLVAAALGIVLGLVVGLFSGYIGRFVDEVLMRFTDMLLVIPTLPLLLVMIAIIGPSLINLIIVLGVLGWTAFARVVRSQVLSLKERPFIEAARASGAGTLHIVRQHIIPNVVSLTYVNLALAVPGAILSEAALSWLGLYDPAVTSWGRILYNAQVQGGIFQWWWTVPPGVAIAAVSLSFVLIGYALDEIFNPRLRKRK